MPKLGWQLIVGLFFVIACKGEATTERSDSRNEEPGIPLPDVPPSLDEFRYAPSFVSVWENRLFELNETKDLEKEAESSKPKMILTPSESQISILLPDNAPDPLYSKSYGSLADNFLLDSMSTITLNHEDNRLETPEGHSIQSISGKGFLFKRNLKTKQLTVNGIRVLGIRKTIGSDPVSVLELDGFLFNHRSEISKAFNELFRKSSYRNTNESATTKQPTITSKEPTTMTSNEITITSSKPTTMTVKPKTTNMSITTITDNPDTNALNNTEPHKYTSALNDETTFPSSNTTTMPSTNTMNTTTISNATNALTTSTKKPSGTTTKNPKN